MRGWHRGPLHADAPFYPGPTYRPPPKPFRSFTPESYKGTQSSNSSEITNMDSGVNFDFEENSPFQEGAIPEAYQRPSKSFFQEPLELNSLVNASNLAQEQADIDRRWYKAKSLKVCICLSKWKK